LASFTVSGSVAVFYDGRLLQPRTDAYTVADTYENYLKSVIDLAAASITITDAFTATSPSTTAQYVPDLAGLQFKATLNSGMSGSTTAIVTDDLIGYGNDYFNNNYYMQVVKNYSSAGVAPQSEIRKISDYVSTSGTFTVDAFSGNAEAGDEIVILHESLIALGRNDADNVLDSSTVAANEDGSIPERLEQIQEVVNKGSGTSLGANRSIVDEIRGAALNYNGVNYLGVSVDLSNATWNTAATHEVFTITGLVRMRLLVECTETVIQSAGTAIICLGTDSGSSGWIAGTSAAAIGLGEIWSTSTPTLTDGNFSTLSFDKIVSNGKDVGYEIGTAPISDGTLVFHCWWEGLNSSGVVAAGSGGVLA
jgi:hypothetical protein